MRDIPPLPSVQFYDSFSGVESSVAESELPIDRATGLPPDVRWGGKGAQHRFHGIMRNGFTHVRCAWVPCVLCCAVLRCAVLRRAIPDPVVQCHVVMIMCYEVWNMNCM